VTVAKWGDNVDICAAFASNTLESLRHSRCIFAMWAFGAVYRLIQMRLIADTFATAISLRLIVLIGDSDFAKAYTWQAQL